MEQQSPTREAISNISVLRRAWGWSAARLADACTDAGQNMDPPLRSTLTRARIAKLECGSAQSMNVDELALAALALRVTPNDLMKPGFAQSTLGERLAVVEREVLNIRQALGAAGIALPVAEGTST